MCGLKHFEGDTLPRTNVVFLTSNDRQEKGYPDRRRPFLVLGDHIIWSPVKTESTSTRTNLIQSNAW